MSAAREAGAAAVPRASPKATSLVEEDARATSPEGELIHHLEPDQLVAETFRPVPRARLSARVTAGLWALRIFVLIVSAMVIYTFLARL